MVYRSAFIALVSLIVLIFVGAIVRATGSGLGCPDWPTCWGCLVPPTSAEQIDVSRIDLEKFKRQAERRGIDPESVTRETVLESFNPVHTWVEFVNRLTSLPLGFSTLMLAITSLFWKSKHRRWIVLLAWLSLIDVLFNAYLGAVVVRTGLQPGIITAHMAMAFLLICVLVTVLRLSSDGTALQIPVSLSRSLLALSAAFCMTLLAEGLLGSQVREHTDRLASESSGLNRNDWIDELAGTSIYLIHRSFSWVLLLIAATLYYRSRSLDPQSRRGPRLILGLVVAMMLMGVVLAHISVYPVVQVLHVGTTAILLAATWNWILLLCECRFAANFKEAQTAR